MARPKKQGIDYFSIDVIFEDNMNFIISEYGAEGLGIVIGLFQKIYQEGYYIEWNKKVLSLFSQRINAKKETIEKVINSCFEEGIFSEEMYKNFSILTSRGIQNRYLKICKDCRRKIVIFNKKHLLVNSSELTGVITELLGSNTEKNPVSAEETPIDTEVIHEREREREREREIERIENSAERVFHDTLISIKNYNLDLETERVLFYELESKFPQLDILKAINKFALYKKDKPFSKSSNVINQITASFEKYVQWGECLKSVTEDPEREVWV